MTVAFRQALITDADLAYRISRDAVSSIADFRGQSLEEAARYFFSHKFDADNSAFLEQDNTTVGFVRLFVSNLHVVVNQLMIAPQFQSNGVGSDALSQLQARWTHVGVSASVSVPKSRRSRLFFERAGFIHAGSGSTYDTLIWCAPPTAGRDEQSSVGRE